jgi:cytosine/adenosine deaminase-related metal-dependent hydrolase
MIMIKYRNEQGLFGAGLLMLAFLLLLAGCGGCDGEGEEDGDAHEDVEVEGEEDADAADVQPDEAMDPDAIDVQPDEAFDPDGVDGPDGDDLDIADADGEDGEEPVEVIHCADLVPPSEGTCTVTAGSSALLILGNILAPEVVLEGGQVLVASDGTIACVDCDCTGEAEAAGATVVTCAHGIVSPGLVNAHDHLTYTHNAPGDWGEERYDHRHEWRRGLNGHTRIPYLSGATTDEMQWGELRQVMSGTTSIAGSGGAAGFLRNVDRGSLDEGLDQGAVYYETFPLGDGSSATLLTSSCNYPDIDSPSVLDNDCYLPHVAEGVNLEARNEFLCLSSTDRGGVDLTEPGAAFIHGVGMQAADGGELALSGTAVIWSPRTNISLYGNTAPVTMYHRQGVLIGLGTDWTPTGSIHMLRELQCAAFLNDSYFGGYFTDRDLWLMATAWSASALSIDDAVGLLDPGLVADMAIYDGGGRTDYYRALIDAAAEDTVLVLRAGLPLYGDAAVMAAVPGGQAGCEEIPGGVCSVAKTACIERETGETYASLAAANASAYGLFFCGVPTGEPTCVPMRPGEYTGEITATDADGDGVPNVEDNCPAVFNPGRILDGGIQADNDNDAVGDACDLCPLEPYVTDCTPPDPNDRDGDGIVNADDNCPYHYNPGQEDRDDDDKGDLCDPCPDTPNPGMSPCPASIYDIKTGVVPVGSEAAVTGVVTAVSPPRFFIQVPEAEQDVVLGAAFSGIFVYVPTANPEGLTIPAEGDRVTVSARVQDYYGQIQLSDAAGVVVLSSANPLPTPVTAATTAVATGGAQADDYEAVLVTVESGEVTQLNPPAGPGDFNPTDEYVLDDALRVNDYIYRTHPFPEIGEILTVTGVLRFANEDSKLEPRRDEDVVFVSATDPRIRAFGPSPVFVDEGTAGVDTSPPLVVELLRPAPPGGVVVALESSDPTVLAVPSTVTVPEGSASTSVLVSGVLGSMTPVTVTATLGTDAPTAQVVVIASDRVPAPESIEPPSYTLALGRTLDLLVTLDIPAGTGGTTATIDVSDPAALSAPADVTFPEGTRTAAFSVQGLLAASSITVTVYTSAGSVYSDIEVVEILGTPFFSEYIEGSSYNKAVEIFNGTADALDLSLCHLNRYSNGTTTATRIGLEAINLAPGDVYVVCNPNIADLTHCNLTNGNLSHNGNDAIELVCGGAAVDVIGQIGFDPGAAGWGTGTVTTTDHTLRRMCSVLAGDPDGTDAFDPAVEWEGFPSDTLDGLGEHCP